MQLRRASVGKQKNKEKKGSSPSQTNASNVLWPTSTTWPGFSLRSIFLGEKLSALRSEEQQQHSERDQHC